MDQTVPLTMERATVVGIDPSRDAYRVRTQSGRVFVCTRLHHDVGDHSRLPVGSQVAVDYRLGPGYITFILPDEVGEDPNAETAGITDTAGHGGDDPTFQRNFRIGGRSPGAPNDILPGDFVKSSPDGASIGALHGKVALLRGSPLAQVRALGSADMVHLVSGVFRHDSWAGHSQIINEDGKTSFIVRMGSDQLTETGPDEDRYTVRLDVGHTGDLINLRVTTPDNQELFRFHVSAEGRLNIYARGGVGQMGGHQGASHHQRHQGDYETEVDGSVLHTTSGRAVDSAGEHIRETADNDSHVIGQDQLIRINRNKDESVGGTSAERIQDDKTIQVSTGNFEVTSTVGGATVTGSQAVTLESIVADIVLKARAGYVKLETLNPDSVILGNEASNHATMYEPLATAFAAFLAEYNAFKAATVAYAAPSLAAVAGPATLDLSAARTTRTLIS